MCLRRMLAALIATAALTGLGLTGAATATAATAAPAARSGAALTPGECEQGGGTVDWSNPTIAGTGTCRGGMFDGQMVD